MSKKIRIIVCHDHNHFCYAAQPKEIAAYLELFDIVIVEHVYNDIPDSSVHVSSLVHISRWNTVMDVLQKADTKPRHNKRLSVNGSLVYGGDQLVPEILKLKRLFPRAEVLHLSPK